METRALDPLTRPGVCVDVDTLLRLGQFVRQTASPRRQRLALTAGLASVHRHGRGLEPHEIRPWSMGDEARHVDRNATARRGEPQVRLFRDEREPRHALVADFRPSMLFGTRRAFRSVAAAEVLALIGWRAARLGARIGGVVLGAERPLPLRGGLGDRGMQGVIGGLVAGHAEALRDRGEAADPPLGDLLAAAAPALPRHGGTVTLATALEAPGPTAEGVLLALKRRSDLRVVLVTDPFEDAPPDGDYPYTRGTDAPARIAAIRRRASAPSAAEDRLAWLGRLGIRSVAVGTADAPAAVLAAVGTLNHDRGRP